jgi:hypothetical protein
MVPTVTKATMAAEVTVGKTVTKVNLTTVYIRNITMVTKERVKS